MAPSHTETFQVRHDECDAYGVLNNAIYLRFAQEAAWRHSISAGFGPDYYESARRAWVARDTLIEYHSPVGHGELLDVTTYVPSARRSMARRAYEFRLVGSDALIAHARTDSVFYDLDRLAPASIPNEIIHALFTDGEQVPKLKRSPSPNPPPAPAGVVTWRGRVQWRDVDPYGHLNNAAYLSYTEAAATEAGMQYGITQDSSREAGVGWALKRSRMQYLEPARAEDILEIRTWLSTLRKASAERQYEVYRASDQRLLARGMSLWLTIDLITGRPRRLPSGMVEALAPNVSN